MYITVKQIANAINNKEHLKTGDIIKSIHVMVTNNNSIHYMVIDSLGNNEYYNENTIPCSIVRLMNYNRPQKAWKRDNKEYFTYYF
jgi:hypothetical protein